VKVARDQASEYPSCIHRELPQAQNLRNSKNAHNPKNHSTITVVKKLEWQLILAPKRLEDLVLIQSNLHELQIRQDDAVIWSPFDYMEA
jgi:hypothetical protein